MIGDPKSSAADASAHHGSRILLRYLGDVRQPTAVPRVFARRAEDEPWREIPLGDAARELVAYLGANPGRQRRRDVVRRVAAGNDRSYQTRRDNLERELERVGLSRHFRPYRERPMPNSARDARGWVELRYFDTDVDVLLEAIDTERFVDARALLSQDGLTAETASLLETHIPTFDPKKRGAVDAALQRLRHARGPADEPAGEPMQMPRTFKRRYIRRVMAFAVLGVVVVALASTGDELLAVLEAVTGTNQSPHNPGLSPQARPKDLALGEEGRARSERDITAVLRAHHRAIVDGNLRAAWDLTSTRYRARKLREPGGYEGWAMAQRELGRWLKPNDLHASIQEVDRRSGVATVNVTGMRWTKPGSLCSTWSGVTWARFEHGLWRYEPGYAISDQRRSKWYPRRNEILGWGC